MNKKIIVLPYILKEVIQVGETLTGEAREEVFVNREMPGYVLEAGEIRSITQEDINEKQYEFEEEIE